MSGGNSVDMVYLDFAKAFDKVYHGVLLHKIKTLGITGRLGVWMYHFLTHITHFVRLQGGVSFDSRELSGVPQGTVLGPLLFIILMGDINRNFTEIEFNNYFTTPDNFSLFNLNIRSIPKNVVNLQHFIEGIHINFSVLSFTETWLTEYNIYLHNFTGYSHVYNLRHKRRRGGVSMFINNRLDFQV